MSIYKDKLILILRMKPRFSLMRLTVHITTCNHKIFHIIKNYNGVFSNKIVKINKNMIVSQKMKIMNKMNNTKKR